jgi:hypothetical protein
MAPVAKLINFLDDGRGGSRCSTTVRTPPRYSRGSAAKRGRARRSRLKEEAPDPRQEKTVLPAETNGSSGTARSSRTTSPRPGVGSGSATAKP